MKFIIYSKTGCPYCSKIKQIMEAAGFNHTIYMLDEDFTRDEFYEKFGNGSTFPQVISDGKNLGGCTETIKYLREKGMV